MCLDQSISPGQGEAFQFLVQKSPKDLTRVNKGPSKVPLLLLDFQ